MTETELIPRHEGQELPLGLATLPRGDLLLGYQQRALGEVSHHALLVIEKSRRIGLTWALAAKAVLVAGAARDAGGKDALYISYAQEMTREFIDACAMWAKAFSMGLPETSEFLFDDIDEQGNTKSIKAFRITFASGFEIIALSSRPRSLRGKHGLLIIDEAAFVDDLAELLKAAMAFRVWGGQVVVISTHDGIDNPFNLLIDEIKSGRRKGGTMCITFDDAVADGLYERVCLVSGMTPTPEGKAEWIADVRGGYGEDADEELDCKPKAGAGSYLDMGTVAACEHEEAGKPELYEKGLVVIGRDIARRRDADIMWAFEIVGTTLWLRERSEGRNRSFRDQKTEFDRLFRDYRVLRANLDQTGMGEVIVEQEIEQKGERVHGVLFTPSNRLDMAIAMKRRFEDGTIRIPANDPAVRADLRAIKKAKGAGDNVRLVNDDTVHADIFWAVGLACLAAGDEPMACHGYEAAPRAKSRFDEGLDDDGDGIGRMRMRPDERSGSGRRFGTGTF